MKQQELEELVDELRDLPHETEWVEFKGNDKNPQGIGEYISALSNSACLCGKQFGYLIFGIEDKTHNVIGTTFKPREMKIGNEELENWLAYKLKPRKDFEIIDLEYDGFPIVVFKIDAACNMPVSFDGVEYVRVGSYKKKFAEHPEKEREIWLKKGPIDWSAKICEGAVISDLEPAAIQKARENYKEKHLGKASEVDEWDTATFLNKAKITIKGQITTTAVILLGKEESEHFLSPSVARITWLYKNADNLEKDYEHFGPPFLLNTDSVLAKIRNFNYRLLPPNTLFPYEITQYEPYVIREALHNCIAHQDYELRGRITVVEKEDELLFTNLGSFIPGSIERVIEMDSPPEYYRNPFLTQAMVNLNMIDTIGGGIRKMFGLQRKRFFPMPDYDLSECNKVKVRILGKTIDEDYTNLLMENSDLDIRTVIALDNVSKKKKLELSEIKLLKSQNLIEGRKPNFYVSKKIAQITRQKVAYTKYRGFDKQYYQDLIKRFIIQHGKATRKEINDLLMNKLPDNLNSEQKRYKISNLLNDMANKLNILRNQGSKRKPVWVLFENN